MHRISGLFNTIFLIFSIALLGNCSGSKKKVTSELAGVNELYRSSAKAVIDTVFISDMEFLPAIAKVHRGDTIVWINHDIVAHCVTEIPDKIWTSTDISPGGSWKMEVKQSSDYNCAIHPVMKGKIVIK